MKNSADLGGCYPPRPSASVDNTLLYLQNSSYPTQPHSIIAKYLRYTVLTRSEPKKSETAVHCCDSALLVLVMLMSRRFIVQVSHRMAKKLSKQ